MSLTPLQHAAFDRLRAFATASEPLAPYTTYKLGGPAAVFAAPRDEAELALVGEVVRDTGLPGDVTLLQAKRTSSVCNGVPQLRDCLHLTYSAKPKAN